MNGEGTDSPLHLVDAAADGPEFSITKVGTPVAKIAQINALKRRSLLNDETFNAEVANLIEGKVLRH